MRNELWHVVLNPASGAGSRPGARRRLERALARADVRWRLLSADSGSEAERVVGAAVRNGARHFAVAGGDGTANTLLNALGSQPDLALDQFTIGLLPLGTGNDWARTMGVPLSLDGAARLLGKGTACRHDVGVATCAQSARQRYFINVAGAGFDAAVVRAATRRGLGRLRYLHGLLSTAGTYRSPTLRLSGPGFAHEGPTLVAFAQIGRYLAGGMQIARNGSFADGLFDLTVVASMPAATIVAQVPRLFWGDLTRSRWVTTRQTAELEIDGDAELQVDGELIGRLPASLRLLPSALRVIAGPRAAVQA
ncbi:MAG TPA: diacylglycerol kinase family protein [Steroidobacteraceae bacterium]|nr:diacylglycerol kinase family protein [Steroidobacteraceae bacterium]